MARTLLTLQCEDSVSFKKDPEALGCLLYEIIVRTTSTSDEVHIDAINHAARSLGYHGSINAVRRLLLSKGFLSEIEKGHRFSLQEVNRKAIQQFFNQHQILFSSRLLSDAEHALIFNQISGEFTASVVLVRVMQLLGFVLRELETVSMLERNALVGIAVSETDHFVAMDHVQYLAQRLDEISARADEVKNARDFDSNKLFYHLSQEFARVHVLFGEAINNAQMKSNGLYVAAHEKQIVGLLMELRKFLLHFVSILLREEEKIA